jgi:hypothetical protein
MEGRRLANSRGGSLDILSSDHGARLFYAKGLARPIVSISPSR